ncbi:MAG: indolepyruvate ferredoxin oxidoreductase family protein [Pseudomonadota bacterium]
MALHDVSLEDRFDLRKSPVLLSGVQGLVRLMLMQAERDRARGWRTAGYVTGYRGSPLGGLDMAMQRAAGRLGDADVRFQPALNEDLAATALMGSQSAALRGEGRVEGVFGLWYGKGPGVDRSGDALRHANLAGTAAKGGVLMVAGDDHTGESSTTCHQSDLAMIDAGIPVLYPAGVQDILDFGLYGFALSRFSGLWAGMKAVKDTVESTAVVDGDPFRTSWVQPDVPLPPDGLSIRLGDNWVPQEERLVAWKWPAARAFARANGIDRRGLGRPGAKIGIVAAGKAWNDTCAALDLLGITGPVAQEIGLTTWKLGQIWPMEETAVREWAEGLDLVVVVEEKRKVIEPQLAQALWGRSLRLWGERGAQGQPLFPAHGPLDPSMIAERLGDILRGEGVGGEALSQRLETLRAPTRGGETLVARRPWFCAGCPHNTSVQLPEGARAGGGIGCHTMALWMDRGTEGYTQMGAEGASWIGEAPFSTKSHVFQNMGDGTYNHSGMMAVRGAVASGVNMTYKILYNDAVALTGGQTNDGDMRPEGLVAELLAMGVKRVCVTHDGAEGVERLSFPRGASAHLREEIVQVQQELSRIKGVTALVHVQTCAAEKRRRRRKGAFPAIEKRVFIDPDICEGCGDCGVQSNCVAILPLETPLGRKREIDQSSCNADHSCLRGFCPSFVTVEGGTPRKTAPAGPVPTCDRLPDVPQIEGTWNVVVTGIGGTGAVTIGAILAMAARLEGKGAGLIEMAGLAQKGGSVSIHCRFAEHPADITAIRVSRGQADAVIGGDLVTTSTAECRALMNGETRAVVSRQEVLPGDFARRPQLTLPGEDLAAQLKAAAAGGLTLIDASHIAARRLGDAIYANMLLTGVAWQQGLLPVGRDAMHRAIELNGADVGTNIAAFELGRVVAETPGAFVDSAPHVTHPQTLDEVLAHLESHLMAYQSRRLVKRFRSLVDKAPDPELQRAVARGYHKLLTYKDEYEVARHLAEAPRKAAERFTGDLKLSFNLAPPGLTRPGHDGRPRKRRFGRWMRPVFAGLARLKILRATPLDPFGYAEERRMERQLIRDYEIDIARALAHLTPDTRDVVRQLAELPLAIKGFGSVKARAAKEAASERKRLLAIALGRADPPRKAEPEQVAAE